MKTTTLHIAAWGNGRGRGWANGGGGGGGFANARGGGWGNGGGGFANARYGGGFANWEPFGHVGPVPERLLVRRPDDRRWPQPGSDPPRTMPPWPDR